VVTLNNAEEHGYVHDYIIDVLTNKVKAAYFCLADEIGLEEETPHTHIYAVFKSPVRFSTLKGHFKHGHLEKAYSGHLENIEYVSKTGKWAKDKKAHTSIPGTFKEFGDRPTDRKYSNNDLADIYHLIIDGASNTEILREFPHHLRSLRDVDFVRQSIRTDEHKDKIRNDLNVVYVYGKTGVGKTFNLMNNPTLGTKYRVTDYSNPWDSYSGEDTVILDEYHSNLKIGELLNVCDIYPHMLRARYTNKVAMYNNVFIVSNLALRDQYRGIQEEHPRVWKALLRRITKVIVYIGYSQFEEYSVEDYLKESCAKTKAEEYAKQYSGNFSTEEMLGRGRRLMLGKSDYLSVN
jgi:hypothetical protein